jgi:hypothetical protein
VTFQRVQHDFSFINAQNQSVIETGGLTITIGGLEANLIIL